MNCIKSMWKEFISSPVNSVAKWQDARFLWLLMAGSSIFLIIVAHSLFQNYVYMKPCEQCVYIRFAFVCMAIGGLIAGINPVNSVLKIIGYLFGFWGIIQGIMYSNKLNIIHHAAHSDNPFGVQGCSAEPSFPLGLPLERWAPDWFNPTGDCGFDTPIVPDGAVLNSVQEWFVNYYSDGWYLFPASHSVNMAQACLFAFIVCFVLLSAMCASWVLRLIKTKK